MTKQFEQTKKWFEKCIGEGNRPALSFIYNYGDKVVSSDGYCLMVDTNTEGYDLGYNHTVTTKKYGFDFDDDGAYTLRWENGKQEKIHLKYPESVNAIIEGHNLSEVQKFTVDYKELLQIMKQHFVFKQVKYFCSTRFYFSQTQDEFLMVTKSAERGDIFTFLETNITDTYKGTSLDKIDIANMPKEYEQAIELLGDSLRYDFNLRYFQDILSGFNKKELVTMSLSNSTIKISQGTKFAILMPLAQ